MTEQNNTTGFRLSVAMGRTGRCVAAYMLLAVAASADGAPQYSQAECQKLNTERLEIKKKLRQPYQPAQGKKLQQREEEVTRILKRHCKKPIAVKFADSPTLYLP